MISTMEIMMIKEAISSTALENNWGKEKEQEMFDLTIESIIKERS